MKKLFVLLFAIALVSCNTNNGFTIKIEMPELGGSNIILNQVIPGDMTAIDSVVLDADGLGEIQGKIEAPEMMYLAIAGTRQSLSLFMDNYEYTIKGSFEEANIEANGGPQIAFNDYKDATMQFAEKMKLVGDSYQIAATNGVEKDSLDKIIASYYAIADEKTSYDSSYIVDNPSSAVSLYLLRGIYYQLSTEELEAYLTSFDESLHTSAYYTHMSDHLASMKSVSIGMDYVDFELPDSSGNIVKLSDLAGKGVLLIDFWASWCGPCRRANPGVVELYSEFHEQGFDILGVSLDNTREAWLQAIQDDKLTWQHISDVKGWQCAAAKTYAVSSIPHTVLLDKNGKIVAKNLHADELKAKVIELLAE